VSARPPIVFPRDTAATVVPDASGPARQDFRPEPVTRWHDRIRPHGSAGTNGADPRPDADRRSLL